jgi:hypothetical protein
MERSRKQDCLSDLELDRMMAGELADQAAARAHLAGCARCTARVADIEGDRDRYRAAIPPMPRRAGEVRPQRTQHRWLWPIAAAAAAAALFLLWPRQAGHEPDGGDVRIKGRSSLRFYVKRGGRVAEAASGEVVHPGDEIRFAATTEQTIYLVLASVDRSGRVSVYHPAGARAEPFGPGRDQLLPDSILLDGSLGPEVVYGFFCRSPVEVAAVRQALAAGKPALPGCSIDRLELDKR